MIFPLNLPVFSMFIRINEYKSDNGYDELVRLRVSIIYINICDE